MSSEALRDRTSDEAARTVRRRLVPFLILLYLMAYLDRINIGFAAVEMNRDVGLTAATYGLGAGVFFLSYTLLEVPSNLLMVRVGARLWIARIAIVWGLVSTATMFVQGPYSFYLLRVLLGAAEAGFFPGIIFYLTRWVPPDERASTIALFMTATMLAGVIGGPVSGVLLSLDGLLGLRGWQWLFLLEGLPAAGLGVAALFLLGESPADVHWLSPDEQRALTARVERASREAHGALDSATAAMRHPQVWLLALTYVAIPVGSLLYGFFLPLMLQAVYGGSRLSMGFLSALPYAAGMVSMMAVGYHSDRSGRRRRYIATGTTVFALCLLATAWTADSGWALLLLSLGMAGLSAIVGPFWTLATTVVRGRAAAAGIALINSVANVGGFVAPYIVGYLKDETGGFTAGLVFTAAVVGGCGTLPLFLRPAIGRSPASLSPESVRP